VSVNCRVDVVKMRRSRKEEKKERRKEKRRK
jgi:hypothetical protein